MKSKVTYGKLLGISYSIVVSSVFIYSIVLYNIDNGKARYMLPYLLVLTSPWSSIFSVLLLNMKMYSGIVLIISFVASAFINAFILYFAGNGIDKRIARNE